MADINLNFQGSTLYGQKFPNVFIESIDVQTVTDRSISVAAKFEIKLNIKVTKPKELKKTDVEHFIESELHNLKLYTYITPNEDYCNQLESNSFSIKKFHDYVKEYDSELPEESVLAHSYNLTEVISPLPGGLGGSVVVSDVFDSEGNEVVEISNITLTFEHYGLLSSEFPELSSWQGPETHRIENIEKYFFLAFVGMNDAAIGKFSDFKEILYNTHFGNITYYHMLSKGLLASRFYRSYAFKNNEPYYGNVLQSINGKFYSTENYTFEDIKNTFLAVIEEHQKMREGDPTLNKNISDLEAILMAQQNKTNILGEIVNYQSTFPSKDQATQSGLFYNKFVVAFSEVLSNLSAQTEVFQKLYLDSLITDSRNTLLDGTYSKPSIPTDYDVEDASASVIEFARGASESGGPPSFNNSLFFTQKQFICTRTAISVKRMYDTVAEGSYYEPGAFGASTSYGPGHYVEMMVDGLKRYGSSATGAEPGKDGYGYGEYSKLWYELYEKYLRGLDEEGRVPTHEDYTGTGALSAEQAAELATSEANYLLSKLTGIGWSMMYGDLYAGEEYEIGGSESESVEFAGDALGSETIITFGEAAKELNFIIRHDGCFFFDYEAAIRTQSAIARVLNITKLQQYFRLNIPYDQFYFEEASLSRNELMLHDDEGPSIKCTIYADFKEQTGDDSGKYKVYTTAPGAVAADVVYESRPKLPLQSSTGLEWEWTAVTGGSTDHIDMDFHRYKYMRPYAETHLGDKFFPYLKIKNFDIPAAGDRTRQLKYFNTLRDLPDSYPTGQTTLDGYRLTCFQFMDLADDDVSYYNTDADYLSDNTDRRSSIRELSVKGHGGTVYRADVKLIDKTKDTLTNLKNYCTEIYNSYSDYVDEARDICSFNNITNTYNDHFVQALNEKYNAAKPWIKAAYIGVALSDMMFSVDQISKDEFDAKVIRIVLSLSPGTGNLASTIAFKSALLTLINMLGSSGTTGTSPGNTITGGTGEALYFGLEFDFDESVITGAYFPTHDLEASGILEGAREIAPLIVLPDIIFFGGHAMSITTTEGSIESDGGSGGGYRPLEAYAGYVGLVGEEELVGTEAANIYSQASSGGSFSAMGGEFRFYGDDDSVTTAAPVRSSTTDPGDPSSIDRDYERYVPILAPDFPLLVRHAYDEIFLPLNMNDWRSILYGVGISEGGAVDLRGLDSDEGLFIGSYKSMYLWGATEGAPMAVTPSIESRMSKKPGLSDGSIRWGFYEGSHDSHTMQYSLGARLAHEILARSTVDTRIRRTSGMVSTLSTSGYEARIAITSGVGATDANRPAARRHRRSLTELLYLVEHYYLPEANRRIDEEDANRYSETVRGRQNFADFGFTLSTFGGYSDASKRFKIHQQIRESLMIIKEVCESEIADPSRSSRRASATYGISNVVSSESTSEYTGPGTDVYRDFEED